MSSNSYRKWLAFGAGAGIEIGDRDLDVAMVRVRPSGAEVVGTLRIERFAEHPAAEWGIAYSKFLKRHGGSHLAATLLLPRRDIVVRQVHMAGVSDNDLPQAIAFQLDGLHPFSEDEAVYAWARMDTGGNVLVGITRREVIDRYTGLFAEAGIKIGAFTFSAAVVYASLRLFNAAPSAGFLAVAQGDAELETYGESEARPIFSATFDTPSEPFAERARAMAMAELRLPAETPAVGLPEILPKPRRAFEGFDLALAALPYATAIVAACPRLGLHVNLLPEDRRATSSRWMYAPTLALAALLLIGAGSLTAYSSYEDRQYLEKLRAEIARLAPDARKPMLIYKTIDQTRARTVLLDQFRRRTRDDLDALNELTKILEPPAWLNSLEITRDSIRLSGEAQQAAGLLKLMDKSPLFEGSEFAAPMSRSQSGEVFAIRSRREAR
jgi:Tfp pilus assembly protein PilN